MRLLSRTTSSECGAFDASTDDERRRALSAFLLNRRQRIDANATRVGTYIRRENRIGRPFTQEEVAEALDVSRQWYGALELSSPVRPSPALLDRIATLFDLRDDDRLMLFRLAIPEFGVPARISPEAYHRASGVSGRPPRSRVIASWDRSHALGVDPTRRKVPCCGDLDERRAANERLLRAARPIVAKLAHEFSGTAYVVVIADAQGRILDVAGDPDAQRRLARSGFAPGGDMTETAVGTNAIGTTIADRRPLHLLGAEHFCEVGVPLTCTAAPIGDPTTREIAGVIDLTAPQRLVRLHPIGLVLQAALEVEERLALLR
jgi:transcriptional regulator with XRE-family HTH domain